MGKELPPFVVCPICKFKMVNLTEEDYEEITESTKFYTCRKCKSDFVPNMKIKGER